MAPFETVATVNGRDNASNVVTVVRIDTDDPPAVNNPDPGVIGDTPIGAVCATARPDPSYRVAFTIENADLIWPRVADPFWPHLGLVG